MLSRGERKMQMAALALFLSMLSMPCLADTKKPCGPPLRIAVIDTGFGYNDKGHDAKLCPFGHEDFSVEGQFSKTYSTSVPVPVDTNNHGTNIVGIIDGYAKSAGVNYCIVVIKYYSDSQPGYVNLMASVEAIRHALAIGVDIINYSGGGEVPVLAESLLIGMFIDKGGKFVAAAGNEGMNLDRPENGFYPAMEDNRVIVVGNKDKNGLRSRSSNYGRVVSRWEVGVGVTAYDITLSGTSQATAVATGKIVAGSENKCR